MRRFRRQILLVLGALGVVAMTARLTEQPRMAPLVGEQLWTPGVEFVKHSYWGGVSVRNDPGANIKLTLSNGRFEIRSDHVNWRTTGTYEEYGEDIVLTPDHSAETIVLQRFGDGYLQYVDCPDGFMGVQIFQPSQIPGLYLRKCYCVMADPPRKNPTAL